ncbi:MAG: PA14 domain-containing protein [Haloarculaceae archaeon]
MLDGDTRGQSIQIGAILLFAVVVVSFSIYQAFVVPQQNEGVEFNHQNVVQQQFEKLRNDIVSAPTGRASSAVSLKLGVHYPSRTVAVNPEAPTGTLRTSRTTDGSVALAIDNANASGETGDFWNGSTRRYDTGFLAYEPNYNEFRNAPTTVYDNTVVYNDHRTANLTESGQRLVRGRTISLVALNGSLSTTKTGPMTVDPEYVSSSDRSVSVTSDPDGLVYEYYEADYDDGSNLQNRGCHGTATTSDTMPRFRDANRLEEGAVANVDLSAVSDKPSDVAYRYEGQIRVDTTRDFRFRVNSDDGAVLCIDDDLKVDYSGEHAASGPVESSVFQLREGTHDVTVEYYDRGGDRSLRVQWDPGNTGTYAAIPDGRLSNQRGYDADPLTVTVPTRLDESKWRRLLSDQLAANGGTVQSLAVSRQAPYEYYEGDYSAVSDMPAFSADNLVRTGETSNFDISKRDRNDGFAFRFNERIEIDDAGQYTFYTDSDDGSRLYVDGERVVNNDGQHGTAERASNPLHLDDGFHTITVTYFEDDGGQSLAVRYEGPDTGGTKVAIPDSVLSDRRTKELTLAFLSNVSYRLRMAKVGLGTHVGSTGPAYLTTVRGNGTAVPEGSTQKVVLEVRDRYDNPVSGVLVHANTTRKDSSLTWLSSNRTDADGRVVARYEPPDDVDGTEKRDFLNATIEDPRKEKLGDAPTQMNPDTPHNVSVRLAVENTDGSGTGGGGGGGDATGPKTTSVTASPNPVEHGNTIDVTVTGDDTGRGGSDVIAAEWFRAAPGETVAGQDPGTGNATPMSVVDGEWDQAVEDVEDTGIDTNGWTTGSHTVAVRTKDANDNWGDLAQTVVDVSGRPIDDFEDGNVAEYSSDTNQYSVTSTVAYHGQYALQSKEIGNAQKYLNSTSGLPAYPQEGDTFAYDVRPQQNNRHTFKAGLAFGETNSGNDYKTVIRESGSQYVLRVSNGLTTRTSAAFSLPLDTWYEVEIAWGTSQVDVTLTDPATGAEIATVSVAADGTGGGDFVGWYNKGGRVAFDYIRVTG